MKPQYTVEIRVARIFGQRVSVAVDSQLPQSPIRADFVDRQRVMQALGLKVFVR